MSYYTNIGRRAGPILGSDCLAAIGVLESPTDHAPIGTALGDGQDDDGRALWRLTVHDLELPGHWIVIDHRFVPVHADGRSFLL
jgi:hypothetical protein